MILCRAPCAETLCPDAELLREQAQIVELVVETVQLALEDVLVMAFLLFKSANLQNQLFHDRGAAAATLNEIIGAFRERGDLPLRGNIELLRHLAALLGVVDDVEAVRRERAVVVVPLVQLLDEALKGVHLFHRVLRHEIEMTVDVHLGRFEAAQIV